MTNAFVSGGSTIQFNTPPLRDGGTAPEIIQVSGRDSLGTQYVYDKGAIMRTVHRLIFPRVTDSILSALLWCGDETIRGAKTSFTWYDHEGIAHTVRLVGRVVHRQTGPGRHRVEVTLEEDTAWSAPSGALGKDVTAGAAPVWLLRLTVNAVDYWLSDMTVTIPAWNGGFTTRPWVSSWGRVRDGITNALDEFRVAEFSVDCLIDPAASPTMETLATSYPLEKSPAELYLWFRGQDPATSPPEMKFRGYVRDVAIPDDTKVSLTLRDESARLEQYIGTKVDRALFPSADPDDVGKVIPIPFGTVRRLPALAVDSGAQTSLPAAISAAIATFALSDTAYLSPGAVIQVDDEQMLVGSISGDDVTVTRGYNGTLAAAHQKAAAVWECKVEFAYLAADVPVDSVGKVRGVIGDTEVDITAITTRYTGQAGNEHPSYPGRAVVTIPGLITVTQAVDLLVDSGLSLNDAISIVDGIAIDDQIAVSDTIGIVDSIGVSDTINVDDQISVSQGLHGHSGSNYTDTLYLNNFVVESGSWLVSASNAVDGNMATAGVTSTANSTKFTRTTSFNRAETPTQVRLVCVAGDSVNNGAAYLRLVWAGTSLGGGLGTILIGSSTKQTTYSSWFPVSSWSEVNAANTYVRLSNVGGNTMVYEIFLEIQSSNALSMAPALGVAKVGSATKIGVVSKSGTVAKSGAASKSGTVAKSGTVTKSGTVSLAGGVTLSGNSVANTLVSDVILVDLVRDSVSHPDNVFPFILGRCGINSYMQSGGIFPASYRLNGAITEYRTALEWLNIMAFQLRAWFRMALGTGWLIQRPDTLTPVKTIPACRIEDDGRRVHSRRKVAYGDILNRVHVLFDRDWAKPRGEDAYRAISKGENAVSIANFGVCERPDLFMFDFVTDAAMAASVRDYYLARYKGRPWLHEFETFLDHSELGFGSVIALGFTAGAAGEILEAGHAPGSSTQPDTVKFTVLT